MENKMFVSKTGEKKSYNDWKIWAIDFYQSLQEKGYTELPDNWFERATKVLKLEEV